MQYLVIALEKTTTRKGSYSAAEVASIHSSPVYAREAATKLNKLSGAGWSSPNFAAVETMETRKKGDIAPDLVAAFLTEQREARCIRLCREVLGEELEGKPMDAKSVAVDLYALGLSMAELVEQYETKARDQFAQERLSFQTLAQRTAEVRAVQQEVTKTMSEGFNYSFPAVRGIQAGKEFYITQIPFPILVKLFVFDEEQVPPELRAQRLLNPRRAEKVADYMQENPRDYVLPGLTASVSKEMAFVPMGEPGHGDMLGVLQIPADAMLLINDGQHRRRGIELALKADAQFKNETIAVSIYFDEGLARSQQMFADINGHHVKPSSAINALYDHRNPYNSWILNDVLAAMPDIKKRIDFENAAPAPKSYKLWSLIAFKKFVTLLTGVSEKTIGALDDGKRAELVKFLVSFFNGCAEHIPQWRPMIESKITATDVREQFVIGHAVFLEALGMYGRVALFSGPYLLAHDSTAKVVDPSLALLERMEPLSKVDPEKISAQWQGRCVHLGRMQKTAGGVKSSAAQLLKCCGLALPAELEDVDKRVLERWKAEFDKRK